MTRHWLTLTIALHRNYHHTAFFRRSSMNNSYDCVAILWDGQSFNFIPFRFPKRYHVSEDMSSMADHDPFNVGGGPPRNSIPGISTLCPMSPCTQAEWSDLAYLFTSSGVTTCQWYLKTLCAERIDLFYTGTLRSICINISVLIFPLFSYSVLYCLPELLLAFWEVLGTFYINVMEKALWAL